ncbi:WD40-repeat-containing domain protein [Daedaleopsis nitida]|nr:WD40-repeat-containing domain protein [Daedaleopsis nitida]
MSTTTAWDIYAEQLFPLGYGHPLWMPEPSSLDQPIETTSNSPPGATRTISQREVDIGDVGYFRDGAFYPLFNSMTPQDDPINRLTGVPADFTRFVMQNVLIPECARLGQSIVCSRSIRTIQASAEVGGGSGVAPVSATGGFAFETATDAGAFVMLEAPALSRDIHSKRHIVTYMKDNFERWLEFANSEQSWGLNLRDHEIVFICGTTKTSRWAVASFHDHGFRKKQGYVSGDFGPFATVGLSVNISNQILPTHHYRHGPLPRRQSQVQSQTLRYSGSPPADSDLSSQSQCLFVHYYKMKRRLWWKDPMQAAAGPHQLPPGPDNSGLDSPLALRGSSPYDFESGTERGVSYDPVTALLDYIIAQSDAEVAIASDLDLTAIFEGRDIPQDIAATLKEMRPVIEVDEHGTGTLSVDYQFTRKRRNNDEEATQEEATSKRARSHEDSQDYSASAMVPTDYTPYPGNHSDDIQAGVPSTHLLETAPLPGHMETFNPPPDEDVDMSDQAGEDEGDAEPKHRMGGATGVHESSVTSLVYSADGRYAASGSEDTKIIIWDTRDGLAAIQSFVAHEDTVSALAFSRDNSILASASHDETVMLWNVRNGLEVRRFAPKTSIHSLVYTPDGSKLIAGGSDGSLHIWDSMSYDKLATLNRNTAVVTFVIFSPDGSLMATGGTEKQCFIWRTDTITAGEPLSVLDGGRGMLCSAAFAGDNRRIITASDDGSCRIWNAETGQDLVILHEHNGPVWTVAFSPDSKRVASGSSDSTVKVCDSFSGDRLLSLDGHDSNSMINCVAFSPDGQYLASASSDNTVRLWNAADGSCVRTYNEHNDNVTSVLFSPDGKTIASSSHDGTVFVRSLGLQEVAMIET